MRILSLKFQRNFDDKTLLYVSFANNLASNDYWNLYWIIPLGAILNHTAGGDLIILLMIDRITKCLSDVLMSYQREIEFCYRVSKIRDLIRNLQQNHLSICDTINICTINLFVFNNLVPRVSWLTNKEEGAFL